ncbi:MCE family protein [Rhodococcus sp. NPDC058505]|uniref:MCE family protein n=1 Tax=unclassified Rhodococcus (in: high G+C Gram-positive bacteria) TaxID=192944 RepID=UPI003666E757
MDQYTGRSRARLALRGLIAVLVGVAVAVLMVMRGSGGLQRNPEVTVAIPASAGLITGEAPVRYSGVNVGRISGIDSGTESSVVSLQIDATAIDQIPATVAVRVVPRTFFGDIFIDLVDPPDAAAAPPLADGARLTIDQGPDAVALYGVYTKMVAVLDHMQPQKLQTALTALGHALDGRGEQIGGIVDRLAAVSPTLTPAAQQFLDATPEFRTVVGALDAATPDVLATLTAATAVSRTLVDHAPAVGSMFGAAAGFAAVAAGFLGGQQQAITTVVDSAGTILATTAARSDGLRETLARANTFGAAGARVFASGKFDITAVPTFAGPMPYTGADCPTYGDMSGAYCSGAPAPQAPVAAASPAAPTPTAAGVAGTARENPVLGLLESELREARPGGLPGMPGAQPNPATVMMLGPLVRGNEVSVR